MSETHKLRIILNDPDGFYESLREFVEEEVSLLNLSEDEAELVKDMRYERYLDVLSKWFEDMELVRLEVDLDSNTIKVVENE